MRKQFLFFVVRWAMSSLGMWICLTLFGSMEGNHTAWLFIGAGLIFSLVNAIVKPIATLISLPIIYLTMGIFTIILNTAMVALTVWLLPNVHMTFGGAILSSFVISIINYLVNLALPAYTRR